jgi:hypothetical protein
MYDIKVHAHHSFAVRYFLNFSYTNTGLREVRAARVRVSVSVLCRVQLLLFGRIL